MKIKMDKILFVSLYEPCRFGGRAGGPVILLNDILHAVDMNLEVDLIVYNKESIASDLPDNVHFIPWSQRVKRIKKADILGLIPKGLYKDYSCYCIDLSGYNKVIYYPYFSALFKVKNSHAEFFTIGMDSGPMLYLRGFVKHKGGVARAFCLYQFLQALAIDKKVAKISKKIFTVGETDAEFYRSVYLADARFVHHPVTSLIDTYMPIEWKVNEKLKVCFPGGMLRFYVAGLLESILDKLVENAEFYKNEITISFLGKVKYKKLEEKLKEVQLAGLNIEYTEFAESFEEYLSKQHIILLPLLVGAGTKNKTLSALGMGLDMIGTPIAVENVYGIKKEHIAKNAEEFIQLINKRLEKHELFGMSKEEIIEFKKYHSVDNWNIYFWKEVGDSYDNNENTF